MNNRQRLRYRMLVLLIMTLLFLSVSHTSPAQEFTATAVGDYGNVTVMEVTGNYDANKSDGSVNAAPREAVAQEFFKTHKDEYDFLVIFSNFDFQMPEAEAKAFYLGVKNDTQGIGQSQFDNTSLFGSIGKLQGTVDMGNISQLATDPLTPEFESTLDTMAHELMHRWSAYVKYRDANGNNSPGLLGRDSSHWSYLLGSDSVLYGNQWQDNGNGTFTSLGPGNKFSNLDLYLMGMIDKSGVPSMLLIENSSIDPAQKPKAGDIITGAARYVTIDDIIAANGERAPDASTSQKSFKTAFIFITQPGTFTGNELYGIENIRNGAVTRLSILSDGKGIMEVASAPIDDVPTNPGPTVTPSTPRTVPADINEGVQWLMTKQQSDGSWADLSQTLELETASATLALKNFTDSQQNYQNGVQWLAAVPSGNMDFLARRIAAMAGSGRDVTSLVNDVLSRVNADGGWGSESNYDSNASDTALAIKAMAVAGCESAGSACSAAASKAVSYLKSKQNSDGGWGSEDKGGMVQETANVLSAFNAFRKSYDLEDAISRGTSWLTSKQNSDGGFGPSTGSGQGASSTVYDTAVTVMVLQEVNASSDIIGNAVSYLKGRQGENGSWSESVYQTALAVLAIYKATVDPDLSISVENISVIPSTIKSLPSDIVISADIWNLGQTAVSQARVVLYDGDPSTGSGQIGEQTVAFQGQAYTTVTFSATARDGNEHLFYIVVDPDNIVDESNELNNEAVKVLYPEATYDFEVLSGDLTVSANPVNMLDDVTLSARITNKGTMNAYNVQVKYYIDDPSAPWEIATLTMDIPANTTVTSQTVWRASKTGTNLPLTVQVDPYENFAELSETNNKVLSAITVNDLTQTDPNLFVSYNDITIAPNPADQGGNAAITALVKNDGVSSASAITVNFYKGVPGTDGVLLGTQTIDSLAQGESKQAAISWTNIQDSGEKVIYVEVAYAGQEIRTDDNETFSTIQIRSLPDLSVSSDSIVFAPGAPKDGDPVTINATVQNTGEQSASDVVVTAYEGTTLLGTQTISLSGSANVVVSFTYDTFGKTGAHEITVNVDPSNALAEQSENNNIAASTFSVQDSNLWVTEQYISPNNDGVKDSTQLFFRLQDAQSVQVTVVNDRSETIKTFSGADLENASSGSVTWDGLNQDGTVVEDGQYQMQVTSAGALLGSIVIVVDNNRSSLADAIGTDYLYKKDIGCSTPFYKNYSWWWQNSESGFFDWATVKQGDSYDYIVSYPLSGSEYKKVAPGTGWDIVHYLTDGKGSTDDKYFSFVTYRNQYVYYSGWYIQYYVYFFDTASAAVNYSNIGYCYYSCTLSPSWTWSPDRKRVAARYEYSSKSSKNYYFMMASYDGKNVQLVSSADTSKIPSKYAWSPDSTRLAYYDPGSKQVIVTDTSGANKKAVYSSTSEVSFLWMDNNTILLNGQAIDVSSGSITFVYSTNNVIHATLSPDGKKIVLKDGTAGDWEVVQRDGSTVNRFSSGLQISSSSYAFSSTWSPAGTRIAVKASIGNNTYIAVLDLELGKEIVLNETSPSISGWLDDDTFVYGNSDTSSTGALKAYNVATGESSSVPASAASTYTISPYKNYISWSPSSSSCTKGSFHIMGSLLNLIVDFSATKTDTSVAFKGTVADLNLDGWKLEYASTSDAKNWQAIVPQYNRQVIDENLAEWVPSSDGRYFVKLTAWDKAGNSVSKTVQTSAYGSSPSNISGISAAPDAISPNNDGKSDNTKISYRVSAPTHLELKIYDENDRLVKTITREEPAIGESSVDWDGTDDNGAYVADGTYSVSIIDSKVYIIVDKTPPRISAAMGNFYRTYPYCKGEICDYVQEFVDLKGYAVDENIKEWRLLREVKGEWQEVMKAAGSIATVNADGTFDYANPGETELADLSAEDATNFTYKLEAEDYANNIVTVVLDKPAEKAVIYDVTDSTDASLSNPLWLRPTDLALSNFVGNDGKSVSIILKTTHTVRESIRETIIYAKSSSEETQIASVQNPSSRDLDFTLDTSTFIQNLLKEGEVTLVAKFTDITGRAFESSVTFKVNVVCTEENDRVISVSSEETECGGQKNENMTFSGTAISYASCKSEDGVEKIIPYLKNIEVKVQKLPDGTKETVFSESLDHEATAIPFSKVTDFSSKEEGAYEARITVGKDESSHKAEFVIDRTAPTFTLTYPTNDQKICPQVATGSSGQRYAVPIEVSAADNLFLADGRLSYNTEDASDSWVSASTLEKKVIRGKTEFSGTLLYFDVTDIKNSSLNLKLEIEDEGGNWTCGTRSITIDRDVSFTGPDPDTTIFSPNGDNYLDSITATFTGSESTTLSAAVYAANESGSVDSGSVPIRTLFTEQQYSSGTYNVKWDGKSDSGTNAADGKYVIAVSAKDACGNETGKISKVFEVDTVPPSVNVSSPIAGAVSGTIIEVKGSASDPHFQSYVLEAGEGEIPAVWQKITNGSSPVTNSVFGSWNSTGFSGKWTLRLIVADKAGNSAVSTTTVDLGAGRDLIKQFLASSTLFSPNGDEKLDTTTVMYEITADCNVKLEILSAAGTAVRSLSETQTTGTHNFTWDGKDNSNVRVEDGSYTVKLTALSGSNTEISQTEEITVTVDATPPSIDVTKPGDKSFSAGNVSVSGSVTDSNLSEYSISYASASGSVVLDRGNQSRSGYTFGTISDPSEGSYTLAMEAKDAAENVSQKTVSFTVDKTAPNVKLETPKNGDYFGSAKNVAITGTIVETNLESYSLRYGQGENPETWTQLSSGSAILSSSQLPSWEVGPDSGIADGKYTLSLYAKDKAGSEAEARVSITIDNSVPAAAITAPVESGYVKASFEIKGTASDVNLDKYSLDISEGSCSDAYKWSPLKTSTNSVSDGILAQWQALPADGTYCLKLTVSDKIGNAADKKVNVKVDTHPPAGTALIGRIENKSNAYLEWMPGSNQDMAGYNIYRSNQKINSALLTAATYSDTNLAEGTYGYAVAVVDNAGNESQLSNAVNLKIDLTGPDAKISSPQDGSKVTGSVDLKGTAASYDDFKEYRVYVGSGASRSEWTLVRMSPAPVSFGTLGQIDFSTMPDGTYAIKIEAEDLSGNVTQHQISVSVDNTPPAAPVLTSATKSGSTVTAKWQKNTETDLAGYLLYKNYQLVNASGEVTNITPYLLTDTYYYDSSLPDGVFKYYIVAVDTTGNISPTSNSLDVTIENHAPSATIVEPSSGTKFGSALTVKADCSDLDVASMQFQYKGEQDSSWVNLGGPVTDKPFAATLDPTVLGFVYGSYSLRAVATDSGGKTDSAPSSITVTFGDVAPPAAPQNLTATTNGKEVALTWTSNTETDVTGYNVYSVSGSTKTKVNTSVITKNTYQINGLADGNYTYSITAVDSAGNESSVSSSVNVRIFAPVLIQPHALTSEQTAQIDGKEATAGATADIFSDSGSGPVYQGSAVVDGDGRFSFATALSEGENRISARVTDSAGNSSRTSDSVVVFYSKSPAAPEGLAASVQDYAVHLNWNRSGENNLLGYFVSRDGNKIISSSPVSSGTATASSSVTGYAPSNAFDGDANSYWMAYSSGTFSPISWEIDLPAPELINRIEINWLMESEAGKNFEIQVWAGSSWIAAQTVSGNSAKDNVFDFKPSIGTDKIMIYITETNYPSYYYYRYVALSEVKIFKDDLTKQTSFDEAGLMDGTYTYTVTAVNRYGFESVPSEEARAAVGDVIPPPAPQNVTAEVEGSTILLGWGQNAETDLAGYNVYKNTDQGWVKINGSLMTSTSYVDANLMNGTYSYRVTALDMTGNESDPSAAQASVSVLPPQPPLNLSVSADSAGSSLTLSWEQPTGSVAGYFVYRGITKNGLYSKINSSAVSGNFYLDAGLTNGTSYYYVATSVDSFGNESVYSNEAVGIPADISPPAKPEIFYPTIPGSEQTVFSDQTDIVGTAETESTVEIFVNGILQSTTSAGAGKTDQYSITIPSNYDAAGRTDISVDFSKMVNSNSSGEVWLQDFATGNLTRIAADGYGPKISPDGKKVLFTSSSRLKVYDLDQGTTTSLTGDAYYESSGAWSPDGSQIAFYTNRTGNYEIWTKNITTGELKQMTSTGYAFDPFWSPDGGYIGYSGNKYEITDLETGEVRTLPSGVNYRWSPDGSRILYTLGNSILAYNVENGEKESIISQSFIAKPIWSHGGKKILFASWNSVMNKYALSTVDMSSKESEIVTPSGINGVESIYSNQEGQIAYSETGSNKLTITEINGKFQADDVHLSFGVNVITARATDAGGNTSPLSDEIILTYDTSNAADLVVSDDDIYLYPPYPVNGEQMAINIAVWNKGQGNAEDVNVHVYLWNASDELEELASRKISYLATGAGEMLSAAWDSTGKVGENRLVVVIDSYDSIAESDESNNMIIKDLVVTENEGIMVTARLDNSQYASGQNAGITITVWNNGVQKDIELEAQIEDESGYPVAVFGPKTISLGYGTNQTYHIDWNTGNTYAGEYRLHSIVKDGQNAVAETSVSFTITPDISIDASLTTDKAVYVSSENVSLSGILANKGLNYIIPSAIVKLQIADTEGNPAFSSEKSISNFLPKATASVRADWNTSGSAPGIYTAVLYVYIESQLVSTQSGSFTIASEPSISGNLTVSPSIVSAGSTIRLDYALSNSGNDDASGITVKVVVADLEAGTVVETYQDAVTIFKNSTFKGQVELDTAGYGLKTYSIALLCVLNSETKNISTTSFTVKDLTPPVIIVSAPTGTTYTSTVSLSVFASDDASGIDQVEYRRDNGSWSLLPASDLSSGRYGATWEPTMADDGPHTVSFRATDGAGNTIDAVTVEFVVDINRAPTEPSLAAPVEGSDVETATPTLIVNAASDPNNDPLTYEFEVYEDNGLTKLVAGTAGYGETAQASSFTVPVTLTENQTYYWRSRAYDARLYGPWMSTASFRVNTANDLPTAPVLTTPADNTEVPVLTPVLVVLNSTDADSVDLTYNFEVSLDPEFTQVVASVIGVFPGEQTTSWQVPVDLNENGWYYWRAQADDWVDQGPWSAPVKFFINTGNDAPSQPVIISPLQKASAAATAPDVTVLNSMDPDSAVISYTFELDVTPGFDSPSLIRAGNVAQGQDTTVWHVEGLADNTKHYVRAKASDGSAESSWSDIVEFFVNTANDAPGTPVAIEPSDGAGVNVFTPTLTVRNAADIDGDALTYAFEVYEDTAMQSLAAKSSGVAETAGNTSWTVSPPLVENHTYYWRARASDSGMAGGWTSLSAFTVNTGNDPPAAPGLLTPEAGSTVTTLQPTLSVTNAVDPDSATLTYDFELYSGDALVWTANNVPQAAEITSVTVGTVLVNDKVYTWRARAFDGEQTGAWMDLATFTVHLPQTAVTVELKIEPETLERKSNGKWVQAKIEFPEGYCAKDADISSIRLEGSVPAEVKPHELEHHEGCDHDDHDGKHRSCKDKLKVKFRRSDVLAALPADSECVTVHVTGTIAGTPFEGIDTIRVRTEGAKGKCEK